MDSDFDQVVLRHGPMLLAYLYAIVRERDLAEELLQETFMSAWRQGWQKDAVRNLPAWLRTVARNHAFKALRRHNASRTIPWDQAHDDGLFAWAEESNTDGAEVLEQLRQCRKNLPDQQRRIIELFYDQHRSADQIAGQLGLAGKTVFQTLWLARRNLRECLQRHMRPESM
jgi:RNA polymerase sigma-70 factor (ECF subfamily)